MSENDYAASAGDVVDDLAATSRLLGSDPSLVLHGGGNTSVKAPWVDITGELVDAIYVKGSGWDLASIERAGFAPMPLARLRALLQLERLSDPDMVRELSAARLDPNAPQPSVEALLHAFLPHAAVLHSHADLILTLTNVPDGEARVRSVFGDRVVVIPYVMPGFDLARAVVERWDAQAGPDTIGMVLMSHGVFAFGDSCSQAYERHQSLIELAGAHVDALPAPERSAAIAGAASHVEPVCCIDAVEHAELRRAVSNAAGRPMIVTSHTDDAVRAFVARPDLADLATRGPLTPDHVIRTKRVPMVGRDVEAFAGAYAEYFRRNEHRSRMPVTMLDAAPRVVLDPVWGMLTAGGRAADAAVAADVYRHTMDVVTMCEDRLEGWRPLAEGDLFDVEYWDLEQAKLRRGGAAPPLAGQVALVTGAASGIGRACAKALLANGAAVVGLDRSAAVTGAFAGTDWLGVCVDVTDARAQDDALRAGVAQFGGIDVAVLAAGIFGRSAFIADLDPGEWRNVQAVNLDATANALRALHPFLSRSPVGGRVVIVGSKNVHAPGAGAAAYSASKAAVTQLARVAALEWAVDRIRVNTVHPDAVFDTGLWTPELLAERAAKYAMTVEHYKTRNLLGVEVTSDLVASMVLQLVGPAFSATTGAQIAVDGGNERTL